MLCIAARGAFPEALHQLGPWLQAAEHPDFAVHLLHQADLCSRFPEDTLEFLHVVAGDRAQQWAIRDLTECLEAIREAEPRLEGDDRFRQLMLFVRKHAPPGTT